MAETLGTTIKISNKNRQRLLKQEGFVTAQLGRKVTPDEIIELLLDATDSGIINITYLPAPEGATPVPVVTTYKKG